MHVALFLQRLSGGTCGFDLKEIGLFQLAATNVHVLVRNYNGSGIDI